ncbi:hypothetical protein BaRGS_00019164 [Batillaria attramentaria]|uniref:Uncharacterized protein n=1 Tax=Batillaria attramentaria TaxID=370345 RepID=A0ABD0KQX3_9CAEN
MVSQLSRPRFSAPLTDFTIKPELALQHHFRQLPATSGRRVEKAGSLRHLRPLSVRVSGSHVLHEHDICCAGTEAVSSMETRIIDPRPEDWVVGRLKWVGWAGGGGRGGSRGMRSGNRQPNHCTFLVCSASEARSTWTGCHSTVSLVVGRYVWQCSSSFNPPADIFYALPALSSVLDRNLWTPGSIRLVWEKGKESRRAGEAKILFTQTIKS